MPHADVLENFPAGACVEAWAGKLAGIVMGGGLGMIAVLNLKYSVVLSSNFKVSD